MSKRTLAIDPGNVESAYVIFDGKTILDKHKIPNKELLELINPVLEMSCEFNEVAIEMFSSYGMAVGQTTFDSCVWFRTPRFYLESL